MINCVILEQLLLERSNCNIIRTVWYWSAPIPTFIVIIIIGSWTLLNWNTFFVTIGAMFHSYKYTCWLDLNNIGSNKTQVNFYDWSDVPITPNTLIDWILRILVPIEPKSIVMTGAMFQSYQLHLFIGS